MLLIRNYSFISRLLLIFFIFVIVVDLPVAIYVTYQKIEKQEQRIAKNIAEIIYFFETTTAEKMIAQKSQQRLLDAVSRPFFQVRVTAKPRYKNRVKDNPGIIEPFLLYKRVIGEKIKTNLHVNILHGNLTAQFSYYVRHRHQWINFSFNDRIASPLVIFLLLSQLVLVFIGLSYLLVIARLMNIWKPLHRLAKKSGAETENKYVSLFAWKAIKESIFLIENTNKQLNESLNEKVSAITSLSHDIRTPLTRALLYVQLMPTSSSRQKLERQLLEIQYLLDETLNYAKQGYYAEPKSMLDMVSLVESICLKFQDLGEAVKYHSDVSKFIMQGQRIGLQRAFTNLIENAIKYGQIAIVSLQHLNNKLIVTIDDQGSGLPDELLEKTLMAFYRYVPSRSRQTDGTGLGLAIAKAIIENNSGKISLTNLEQGGLRVNLSFSVSDTTD